MAKKKAETTVEEEVMVVEIEDETTAQAESRTWQEDFEVAGSELQSFLSNVGQAMTARRIIVKNADDRVLVDVPIVFGTLGVLGIFPPMLPFTIATAVVALVTQCKVTIVHEGAPEEDGVAEPVVEA